MPAVTSWPGEARRGPERARQEVDARTPRADGHGEGEDGRRRAARRAACRRGPGMAAEYGGCRDGGCRARPAPGSRTEALGLVAGDPERRAVAPLRAATGFAGSRAPARAGVSAGTVRLRRTSAAAEEERDRCGRRGDAPRRRARPSILPREQRAEIVAGDGERRAAGAGSRAEDSSACSTVRGSQAPTSTRSGPSALPGIEAPVAGDVLGGEGHVALQLEADHLAEVAAFGPRQLEDLDDGEAAVEADAQPAPLVAAGCRAPRRVAWPSVLVRARSSGTPRALAAGQNGERQPASRPSRGRRALFMARPAARRARSRG